MKTKQLLKSGIKEFIKTTKGNDKEVFYLRSFENDAFWIYNGYLLTTNVFNLKHAIKHEQVSIAKVKKDTVYVLSQISSTNIENIFNI